MARIRIRQPLVHQLPMRYLLIVPILLCLSAAALLTIYGGVNTTLLYSQCHARSRLPVLSDIPVLGPPACFLVSLLMFATASTRGVAQLGVIVSFTCALLTVSRVEAARKCNRRSWNIRFPTPSWLAFNLVGGSLVWDLWIIPAFLQRAKDVRIERVKEEAFEGGRGSGDGNDEDRIMLDRSLTTSAEVWAIPLAIIIGFVVPSAHMLVLKDVTSVMIWLFFPMWVAVAHWFVKFIASRLLRDNGPLNLESHLWSIGVVYALPFAGSLAAHAFFTWDLFCQNHSKEMTRMALNLIVIDFASVAATVLYWVLAEAGIVPAILLVVLTVFLGPGAALCLAWLLRERAICAFVAWDEQVSDEESDGDDSTVHEYAPLLR